MAEGRSSARAVFFTGRRNVEVKNVELNRCNGELFVESRLIGISHGTEMNLYRGTFSAGSLDGETLSGLRGRNAYPIRYGYINAGTAEDGRRVFAFYPHQNRFYCDPSDMVYLPDDVSFEDAVFFASMETALGIVHDSRPVLGDTGLVAGTGMIGLLVCMLLFDAGVKTVFVSEPSPFRQLHAREIGCRVLDRGRDENLDLLFSETDGRGVDFAVDASSNENGLQFCIDAVATEGVITEASWFGNRTIAVSPGERFHRKRLTIRSSQVSRIHPELAPRWDAARRRKAVLDLLTVHHPGRYITDRFPLEDAAEAFRRIDEFPEAVLQAVLIP